jgi:filamentous hemagglutinin family protein
MRPSHRLKGALGLLLAGGLAGLGAIAFGATLPVPCTGSVCAAGRFGATGFVSAGQATATQSGSSLTVNQTSTNATLNWQSFNISANGTVTFVQPSATAVALNQINDANASQIAGVLNANGRVFLINQNGIIFASGAQVSVGGLVASTLNIDPTAVTNGLIASGSLGNAAFQVFPTGTTGAVTIANGATLQTSNGGQILIFAPQILNQGTISTPGGQTLLAAGNTIFLASSSDPTLRGLLVEVGGNGGTVTNDTLGQISATDGNVTLAGLAVNQLGRVSATTSINENGSIILQANSNGSVQASGSLGVSGTPQQGTGGTLILGANSSTTVTLDSADPSTTVDSVAQPKSSITMTGYTIDVLAGSLARATSGTIDITAELSNTESDPQVADGSRVYVAAGAELDVSGASVTLPVSSNVIPVELRGAELADSPLQQNGPLRGQTVYVDIRTGTPLADVSGEIAAIGHNVLERNLTGGTVNISSHGDAIIAPGSLIDVAGGEITYTAGYLDTSNLITTTGEIVNIGSASPNVLYSGIANTSTNADPKWGTSSSYTVTAGTYSPGYVQGMDAGTFGLSAPVFVLDSNVNTSTVSGIYQRQPDTTLAVGTLFRPYTEVPAAATLVIGGTGGVVGNVSVASGLVLPGLVNADGSAFDPLTDPLPATLTTSTLRPELLGSGGFGNVSIATNGEFLLPAGTGLSLPGGGSFSVSAGLIDVEGGIDVPGGKISLVASPTLTLDLTTGNLLTLGPDASLVTSGLWVNDSPALNPTGNSAPLFVNGGSVSLVTQDSGSTSSAGLRLAPGSLVDVSGGGQLTGGGVLNAGTGGHISIAAEPSGGFFGGVPPPIDLEGTLRGYALYDGGTLSLTASSICIAATNCSGGDPTTLWVSPAELGAGGFSSFQLTADQGGLSVLPGTTVMLKQQNLVLPTGYSALADQSSLIGTARIGTLSDQLRHPVNLDLSQILPANNGSSNVPTLALSGSMPSLLIGDGAVIETEAGGSLALTSDVRILVEGTLRAPAGSISLDIINDNIPALGYEASQGIWLGSDGVLDASGTTQIYRNGLGLLTGNVLAGGTVTLTATRGFIELLPGSTIDVAGTSGSIDMQAANGAVTTEQAASAGGTLSLTAAEGIELGGVLDGAAGVAGAHVPQPAGGSFSLTLDAGGRDDYALSYGLGSTFPSTPRQIVVSTTQPPIVIAPGSAVPDSLSGFAYVSTSALAASGFDAISLAVTPLVVTPGAPALPGSIDFVGNVSLSAGQSLSLNATAYSVSAGATANLSAPYVEFGNSSLPFNDLPTVTTGTGTLNVSGGFIELYGTSALLGVGTAAFDSSGDLRVRGVLDTTNSAATTPEGGLYLAGDLTLSAQQVYPTTLTNFVVSADPASVPSPSAGSITVVSVAGSDAVPLSAGGALTLSAGSVAQNGILRAPFGTIAIDAQSIDLGPTSLTSTSGAGLTVPFGTTQGGIDWVYPLANGTDLIYGTDGSAPPAQQITLQAGQINLKTGAVVDVSGGGDLQAYEWINGTAGTNDVLSQSVRPNQYAIFPGANAAGVVAYDPNISAGSTLEPGAAVYLYGIPGVPAGVYTLWPARYALLPGAYLVTEVSGYQGLTPGVTIPVAGGGTLVAGYNTIAGTAYSDSRTNGFDVVPASVVLGQAQYNLTSANQFFASQAATAGVAAPRLPQDAGVLALIASDTLTLDGTLRTTAPSGGLGAEVDISSADILVAAGSPTAQPGQIVLDPASLNALGAQTLLLGGLRDGSTIDTTALSIEVASGADLSAPLVLLSALDTVTLDPGSSVNASGSAPGARSYTLSGDGAFLSVSSGVQSAVLRTDSPGVDGVLSLAPGSSISAAGGSVYLEASTNVVTGGTLALSGADLAVQSPDILLGAAIPGTTATVLGSSVLAAPGLRNLLLASGSAIEVNGSVSASAATIILDTPGVFEAGTAGSAGLTASSGITLQNSSGATAAFAPVACAACALTISAPTLTLGGGAVSVSGFGLLGITAPQGVVGAANGALATAGDLTVTTAAISTAADVDLSLSAGGATALLAPATSATATASRGLGGSLNVSGASISVGTQLLLPSGLVALTANGADGSGNLSLETGGVISVAGVVQQYNGVDLPTPGGSVTLASTGGISLAAGSLVDVSAGSGGQGGSLVISAPAGTVSLAGTLKGTAAVGTGASFSVDAYQFGSLDALDQLLTAGGFSGAAVARLEGPGDLLQSAGSTLSAAKVSLEADQGNVTVNGVIDAAGAAGGAISLSASGNVILAGTLDAHATSAIGNGGTVTIGTTGGALLLDTGSSIDVAGGSGGAGGNVWLRAPAAEVTAVTSGGGGVALDGRITGSNQTVLEAFAVYQNANGLISTSNSAASLANPIYAAASSFMGNAPAITSALGQSANASFTLEPGVEIDATVASNGTGTLALNSAWNLYNWRFGPDDNVPGVLTLRAENGITFNASLSDGFAATSGASAFTLPATPGNSWSYRLVAGADFSAADPLAVVAANPANVTIAACSGSKCNLGTSSRLNASYAPVMVRTGDGFIDVSASGDFVLGNQESILYTAGVAGPGISIPGRTGLAGLAYPAEGGNISIDVDGDVIGATTNQFVNAWLWRAGAPTSTPSGAATAWTVNFEDFQQGVGALGGGNVSVAAGGDITNLSVSIPSIGVQTGGTTEALSVVQVTGGGNLNVSAGGSIESGSYYVGQGQITLQAGADVGAVAGALAGTSLAPVLGLGATTAEVTARGNLEISEILNPTLLNRGTYQGPGSTAFFSTYSADASVTLSAVGGNLSLIDSTSEFESAIAISFLGGSVTDLISSLGPLNFLPPSLNLYAMSGNVEIGRNLTLAPSAVGNLQIFANQNFIAGAGGTGEGQLVVSDADPTAVPSAAAPQLTLQFIDDITSVFGGALADQHAPTPVYAAADAAGTLVPVQLVALNGSVEFQPDLSGNVQGLASAKPVEVVAGLDVVDLNLIAQNLGASDVTSVIAGRDAIYAQSRLSNGVIAQDSNGIIVDGPGAVQLTAGGDVNLGTSNGVVTRGNLVNPALPTGGASVSVEVGLTGGAPQFAAFLTNYVSNSAQFDPQVIAFVEALDGETGVSATVAKAQLAAMTPALQRSFVEELFFYLLQIYGSAEAASGNGDFSGAFAAIQALFPGANPNLAAGQKNPYAGNIELYFSQIYTDQGGNISLLAPGGEVNVGLSLAPVSFGINKSPDQLGIVAETTGSIDSFSYSDFQVNQSRVFAADGGDILVWSTEGNIDAGRGAKTAISAPSLNITYDDNGDPTVTLRSAIAGSGIQALAATPGVSPGSVFLFAPHGVVNADDAGIVAGNLTVAATAVLGANNISVSGTTVGVPVAVTGLGASFSGASSSAAATANSAESLNAAGGAGAAASPLNQGSLGLLDVFVAGFGDELCKPEDTECLKREAGSQGGK